MRAVLAAMALSLAACGSTSAALTIAPAPPASGSSYLDVAIEGLRSSEGVVLVVVHDSPEGFPGDAARAVRSAEVRLGEPPPVPSIRFDDLPDGDYAVAIVHDENGDGELDTNWMGIPTEGIGASNEAQGLFGPPDFDEARFEVRGGRQIAVRVVYL